MFRKVCLSLTILTFLGFAWSSLAIADDVKLYDPVCGMEVSKDAPQVAEYDGKTYRFCSANCKSQFSKEPEKYACFCLSGSDCPHCTGISAKCPCDKVRHGHERCHGKHKGGE
ncbi:MAG TPA: YHS domain-containing protein [Candidatus Hypogeohydataceae bacterium YC41]